MGDVIRLTVEQTIRLNDGGTCVLVAGSRGIVLGPCRDSSRPSYAHEVGEVQFGDKMVSIKTSCMEMSNKTDFTAAQKRSNVILTITCLIKLYANIPCAHGMYKRIMD